MFYTDELITIKQSLLYNKQLIEKQNEYDDNTEYLRKLETVIKKVDIELKLKTYERGTKPYKKGIRKAKSYAQ